MNDNKFLTLLMGECFHEWNIAEYCKLCGESRHVAGIIDHFSDPLPVIRWMERNMPEVWESYLRDCHHGECYSDDFAYHLNLSNLVTYLSEHREWGITICSYKKEWPRTAKDGGSSFFCEQECKKQNLPFCDGTGVIKHPALVYLEQEEQCERK